MQTGWILELRKTRRLGARRIANELKRLYDFSLSLATVQKVLTQHLCSILPRRNRQRKGRRRYNRPIPGEVYGGMRTEQAKRVKDLEKENARLKKLVAELSLDNAILKDVASGNF
jgi:hypothetical protein